MKKYRMVITDRENNRVEVNSNSIEYIRKKFKKYFYTGDSMNTRMLDCKVRYYEKGHEVDYLF